MKNAIQYLVIFFILLLFLKTDFRLQEDIYCCGDDHDYYSHAETIGLDKDFDYTNQLSGYEKSRYFKNNKIAPIGFVGTGLLSTPFIIIGNFMDNFFQLKGSVNFKILLYSFSSIFYLFLSIQFLLKVKEITYSKFKNINLIIIFLGSGISYYSFERFSMTHTYEVFTIIMIFYYSLRLRENEKDSKYKNIFLLLLFIFLAYQTRWVNYFVFFIPYLVFKLKDKKLNVFKNIQTLFIGILFICISIFLNYQIYGVLTFNPNYIYSKGDLNNSFEIFGNVFLTLKSFLTIFFTQEFGILYFSPIVFFGILIAFINFLRLKNFSSFLLLSMYLQVFAIVVLWQTTASSYGFRYLYCLIPISLFTFLEWFKNTKYKYKYKILNLLLILSIFSVISTIFFETTLQTQLSLDEQINSFGKSVRYTQPYYLEGFIKSFLYINSYLKIFVTSFLGMIFFNIVFKVISVSSFLEFISSFGLNLNDDKVTNLLTQYSLLELSYIMTNLFIVITMTYFFNKFIKN